MLMLAYCLSVLDTTIDATTLDAGIYAATTLATLDAATTLAQLAEFDVDGSMDRSQQERVAEVRW